MKPMKTLMVIIPAGVRLARVAEPTAAAGVRKETTDPQADPGWLYSVPARVSILTVSSRDSVSSTRTTCCTTTLSLRQRQCDMWTSSPHKYSRSSSSSSSRKVVNTILHVRRDDADAGLVSHHAAERAVRIEGVGLYIDRSNAAAEGDARASITDTSKSISKRKR